ncbi:MAG: DUF86 domain-containing protein [bacterium]|nr:DUF86 domain-containing protein [bacterium]
MTRDLYVFLEDIAESLEIIAEYVMGIDEEDFKNNRQLQDAVIRRFEIVGEAAKQIPDDFRDKYPHIPWRTLAGLRDVLIHHYFGVSIERLWKMIKNDLDKTQKDISKIVDQLIKTDPSRK